MIKRRCLLLVLILVSFAAPDLRAQSLALPVLHEFGFQFSPGDSVDAFSSEDVPLYLDGRPTHQSWTQLFGSDADPLERDRFPRHTMAVFSSRNAHSGRRALLLESSGDHLLLRSKQRFPVDSGDVEFPLPPRSRIELEGWTHMRGLRHGGVVLELRFVADDGFEISGTRVRSEPLRGDRDWSPDLKLSAVAPPEAAKFDFHILLEGSYRDPEAEVWIDDLSVRILPGCEISWPGQKDLYVLPGEPLVLQMECAGLGPGVYRIRMELDREWPAGHDESLSFETSRFIPSLGMPLRMREDLRKRFNLDRGLYRARVMVSPPENGDSQTDGGSPAVIATGDGRIAVLGEGLGSVSTRQEPVLKIGWIVPMETDDSSQILKSIRADSEKYSIHQIMLDFSRVAASKDLLGDSSETGSLGEVLDVLHRDRSSAFLWRGRLRWDPRSGTELAALIKRFFPLIRSWEFVSDEALGRDDLATLRGLRDEHPTLRFGAHPGPDDDLPPWAQFAVYEMRSDGTTNGTTKSRLGNEDWIFLKLPETLSTESKISFIGQRIFDVVHRRGGHLFIESSWEKFAGRPSEGGAPIAPNPFLFSWIGTSKLLSSFVFEAEYDWDPRLKFLLLKFPHRRMDVLAVYTKEEGARFNYTLWTGEALNGFGLLGKRSRIDYSEEDGTVTFEVTSLPVFLEEFPRERVLSALSVKRREAGLRPWPRWQTLRYDITNHYHEKPLSLRAVMRVPDGWGIRSARREAELQPGESTTWSWEVELPSPAPFLREYPFGIEVRGTHAGQTYTRYALDHVALESDVVQVRMPSARSVDREIPFSVRNLLNDKSLRLNLFCRAFLEDGSEFRKSWSGWKLGPGIEREVVARLPVTLDRLQEQRVWIGYQLGGRGDTNTFEFLVRRSGDTVEWIPR